MQGLGCAAKRPRRLAVADQLVTQALPFGGRGSFRAGRHIGQIRKGSASRTDRIRIITRAPAQERAHERRGADDPRAGSGGTAARKGTTIRLAL
jgi:hypothetical protein